MVDADGLARALFWARFRAHVAEYGETGRFDCEAAADDLDGWAKFCLRRQIAVTIPPDFAELVALALAGRIEARGRPPAISWQRRRATMVRFRQRRAAGEKHEVLIRQFAEALKVSRKTVEAWLTLEKRR